MRRHVVPGDFWGITESHLSSLGQDKFRKGMACQKSRHTYLVPGAPCALRARSESVGTFSGVLAMSPWPTRALHPGSCAEWFKSSRLQIVGTCIRNMWIEIAIVYGYPYSTTHQYPRFKTEQLLEAAINRVACQASGPRVIMGDFNWLRPELAQLDRLEAMGFRDLQSIAEQWWGYPVQPTGKGTRQIDFVYVSPELIPLLRDVRVVDSWWPDHSAVVGTFGSPRVVLEQFRWRMPQPIEWPTFQASVRYPEHPDPSTAYAILWNTIEQQASSAAVLGGSSSFHRSQCGRGQTLEPSRQISQPSPIRKGRTGEIQPAFHGVSLRYAQQFKQARQLQSLRAALKKTPSSNGESIPALWCSIRHSTGFPGGFCAWWTQHAFPKYGGPATLPVGPPSHEECCILFQGVNEEVRTFGIRLQTDRLKHAKQIRQHDLQYVFQDCAKPIPKKVDVLVHTQEATIQEATARSVTLEAPCPFRLDQPLVCNGHKFEITSMQDNVIETSDLPTCATGDIIRQSVVTTQVSDILDAFREAWSKRWEKAHHLLPNQWDDIAAFIDRHARPLTWNFPEWTCDRFVRVISGKKKTAAVGPDGVTRNDLLNIPSQAQEACMQVLTHAEATTQWPRQIATGIVSLLEKHSSASTVADYRPIVVYPILYRAWSTFRAKQLLRNLASVAPSGLRGGMPHQEARTIWYELGIELESSHSCHHPLVGIVADLEKAFNHVPRQPIWKILHSLQVPSWLIRTWCSFVSFQGRRFRVRSTTGPLVLSNCGYPEGCALSVAAMCLIDLALDWWMTELDPQIRVYTFVDDWQILHANIAQQDHITAHLETFVGQLDMIICVGNSLRRS